MNLNEVKKHTYFQLAIYIGIFVCFILSLIAILVTPVKAMEQTSDITNQIRTDTTVCNTSGGSGVYCVDGLLTRNVKTTYNGRAQCIAFAFDYYFMQGRDYTINIIANSNDFRNNSLSYTGYSYTTYPANASIVPVQGRFINKQKIQIVFPYDPQETHAISICSNSYMTGDTNYNIKQVYLTYDDGQQDISGIVDNATQNTTDIINNNNSNAEQTQNVIIDSTHRLFESLNNMCPNTFNRFVYNENNNNLRLNNSGGFDVNGYGVSSTTSLQQFCPTCQVGFTYYLNGETDSSNNFIYIGAIWNFGTQRTLSAADLQAPVFFYGEYGIDRWYHVNNLIISSENKPYCAYGSSTNKIDWITSGLSALGYTEEQIKDIQEDIKDKQQQQYDYLTDDTDPSVNQSGINNVLGSVNVQDPLNYLLTLPLNLLTKLNTVISSGTCSRASFGELYGTELYLPCINFENYLGSSLWGTIDTIVGIGLLAIILKKFYDTISNILSLGKEEEIRKGMELPTPMEFFAQILGGGR